MLQHRLGCRNAGSFDAYAACAGSVYSLSIGSQYIQTGKYRTVQVEVRKKRVFVKRDPAEVAAQEAQDELLEQVEGRAWLDVSPEMAATGLAPETLETLVTTYGRLYPRVVDLIARGHVPLGSVEQLRPAAEEVVEDVVALAAVEVVLPVGTVRIVPVIVTAHLVVSGTAVEGVVAEVPV